jgi:hypothetical protein
MADGGEPIRLVLHAYGILVERSGRALEFWLKTRGGTTQSRL